MNSIISTVILTFGLCLLASAAEDRFASITVKTIHVKNNIYALTGAGGTIGVSIGTDGVLLIDDDYAPMSEKVSAALAALNDNKPTFILNTHVHADHTGANSFFSKDGTIIAHENIRVRMVSSDKPMADLPVITYQTGISIHFNGERINVLHVPKGHTDGDSIVIFTESNVVHMGDQLFNGWYPFVDLSSGGTIEGYTENVARVIDMINDDTILIAGHGQPIANKADLISFHNMMIETSSLVRDMVAAHKSDDEIVAAGLGDKWKPWGEGFIKEDRWIRTILASLHAK